MKKTYWQKFTSGKKECMISFEGPFTPYDPGVRYHRDGSGTPPDGPYFEIEEVRSSNDITPFIDTMQAHFDKVLKELEKQVCNMIRERMGPGRRRDEMERYVESLFRHSGSDYLEEFGMAMADEIQEQDRKEEYDYDQTDHIID